MCEFELEKRGRYHKDPPEGKERRMAGDKDGVNARVVLDWVVRVLIVVISVLVVGIFSKTTAISKRSLNLELRVKVLETANVSPRDRESLWQAIAERPTRREVQGDLDEIKTLLREYRAEVMQNR